MKRNFKIEMLEPVIRGLKFICAKFLGTLEFGN